MANKMRVEGGPAKPVVIAGVNNSIGGSLQTSNPPVSVDDNFTGIITITTAGTEQQGGNIPSNNGFLLKGHPDNTDTVWYMPHDRTKANGFPLDAGQNAIVFISNLSFLDFDADQDGEKICWSKL